VLSLVILALGAGGVFGQAALLAGLGRQVVLAGAGPGTRTSTTPTTPTTPATDPSVGIGTAPLPAATVPAHQTAPTSVVVEPAQPLTAAAVGWPLPRNCRAPFARHGGDPALSAIAEVKRVAVTGTVVSANDVTGGELGRSTEPGTPPTVARRAACVGQLWTVVRKVFPQYAVDLIDGFVVFVPTVDRAARGEVVGIVVPHGSVTAWTLALAPHPLSDDELAHTMIHELGHLLTLNESQWDVTATQTSCDDLPPPDGCLTEDAILSDYVAKAWNAKTYRSYLALWGGSKPPSTAAQDSWYRKHRSEFYDSYAATSPVEDFAESFAAWCLKEPMSSTLKPKISFFDGRSDLKHMSERCAALR
jgi:hypothetical protein